MRAFFKGEKHPQTTGKVWNEHRKIILVDFDGVLHSYTSGWLGVDVIPDRPIPGAINWLTSLIATGEDIRIFSARCNDPHGITAMKEWLHDWGMSLSVLCQLRFEPGKPPAHIVIDDRAHQFTGVFPEAGEIEAFKPYRYGRRGNQPKS